jgi:hypothetical protein
MGIAVIHRTTHRAGFRRIVADAAGDPPCDGAVVSAPGVHRLVPWVRHVGRAATGNRTGRRTGRRSGRSRTVTVAGAGRWAIANSAADRDHDAATRAFADTRAVAIRDVVTIRD